MVKRLLLILAFLTITVMAQAEPLKIIETATLLEKLPALDNGVAWDFDQKGLTYTNTLTALSWKGIKLNAGYAGTPDNKNEQDAHSLIAGISYEVTNLEKLGVEIPILKNIKFEPMVYGGWTSINLKATTDSEFVWGVGVKILEIKI